MYTQNSVPALNSYFIDAALTLLSSAQIAPAQEAAMLGAMAAAARKSLQRDDLHAIADKGYFSGAQILACHQAGITTTVPRPETSGNRSKGMYVKADSTYDPARDVYVCPAGEELTYRYTREEGGLRVARYWTNNVRTVRSVTAAPPARNVGSLPFIAASSDCRATAESRSIWSKRRAKGWAAPTIR